jgi:hypothetical protein
MAAATDKLGVVGSSLLLSWCEANTTVDAGHWTFQQGGASDFITIEASQAQASFSTRSHVFGAKTSFR